MIIEQNVNTVQTHGIKLSKEMGIHKEGMGFIQNILRSQIYSDKIMAVIREIAVNAIDSHVEAGCPDRPIEVTLPTRNETTLRIRDFGSRPAGLSSSAIPWLIARLESPVTIETAEIPPYPNDCASAAATRRRKRSSRKGKRRCKRSFDELISIPGLYYELQIEL